MVAISGTVLAGVAAATSLAGGYMAYQQGKAQQDIAKEQARIAIAKGNIEKFQFKQESERVRKIIAAEAGRGGGSLTGSFLENLNQSMTNAELDEEMIGFNAKVLSNNFIQEGRNARAAGKAALISSVGQAAGSFSGFGGSTQGPSNITASGRIPIPGRKPVRI